MILGIARGGFYGPGTARKSFEHAESYLTSVFTFLGVSRIETVSADGFKVGPERRDQAIADARTAIQKLTT